MGTLIKPKELHDQPVLRPSLSPLSLSTTLITTAASWLGSNLESTTDWEEKKAGKRRNKKKGSAVLRPSLSPLSLSTTLITTAASWDSGLIDSGSGWSFSGLSCVWLNRNEGVGDLLPLVSEEVIGGVKERDGDVSYLAGVVIAEVLLGFSWEAAMSVHNNPRAEKLRVPKERRAKELPS
ncbi:hypothetical protein ACLB2K_035661 [Fragaria x ananassa]